MRGSFTDSRRIRKAIQWVGYFLVFLSLLFVNREFMRNWDTISGWHPAPADLGLLASLAIIYGAALFLLAENWHRIVLSFGAEPRRRTYRSYTLTQIARYLPGNVAHLLGRAIILRDGPLSDRELALATLFELVVIPVAAIVVLIFATLLGPRDASLLRAFGAFVPYARFAAAGIAALALVAAFALLVGGSSYRTRLIRNFLLSTAISTLFMMVLGGIFASIVVIVDDGPFLAAGIAGVCAWLLGYATPGAPGGLGTREAVIVILLSDSVSAAGLLISAAVFRMVTVLGDILCFSIGSVLFRAVREAQQSG